VSELPGGGGVGGGGGGGGGGGVVHATMDWRLNSIEKDRQIRFVGTRRDDADALRKDAYPLRIKCRRVRKNTSLVTKTTGGRS